MNDRLAKALKLLIAASKRLQPEQGDRARRNARLEVKTRLRHLDAVVDEVFPAPARKPTKKARVPRFTVVCNNQGCRAVYAREPASGRCTRCRNTSFSVKAKPKRGETEIDNRSALILMRNGIGLAHRHGKYIAPSWAVAILRTADGISDAQLDGRLFRARADIGWRKATLAAIALKEIGE